TTAGVTYTYATFPTEGDFTSCLVNTTNPNVIHAGSRRNLYRWNTFTGTVAIPFHGLPGEFVPDLEHGSTLLGTSTGFYKLNEVYGATSSTWNGTGNWTVSGNWSSGQPDYLMNAKVASGSLTLDPGKGAEVNQLRLAPSTSFTLPATSHLSLNDSVVIGSSAGGSGSFLDQTPGTSTFHGKVQSYLTNGRWHYVSAPANGAKTSSLYFPGGTQTWLKIYKENLDDWEYISSLNQTLTPGKGYAVWVDPAGSNETATYRGDLNKQDVPVSLEYTDALHGWNLLGNPFPCAIDWDFGTWNHVNNTGIAYVWNNGNYLSRNQIGAGSLTDGIIPMGQGFFVQATGAAASLNIPLDARINSNQSFYKSTSQTPFMLNLSVSKDGKSDNTTIGFYPAASVMFDEGMDALRLSGSSGAPTLQTVLGGKPLSINILPELTDSVEVPVQFAAPDAGLWTLSFTGVESFTGTRITLTDKVTGEVTTVAPGTNYQFNAVAGSPTDRFFIRFRHSGTGIGEMNNQNAPRVSIHNGQLEIDWKQCPKSVSEVSVYSVLGQQLGAWKLEPAIHQSLSLPEISDQMVLVSIHSENQTYNIKTVVK
ncbi:MAG: hypothetical protein WCL00_11565, partial [Bacteroidota bacterium]